MKKTRVGVRHCSGFVALTAVLAIAALSCKSSDATDVEDTCGSVLLPVVGATNAPTIVDVGLEVQPDAIVPVATVTDPQGTANLIGIRQSLGVHVNAVCIGAPIVVRDDIAESGSEETFGTAVSKAADPGLYNAIAASAKWPVSIDVVDANGNRTMGTVQARLIR